MNPGWLEQMKIMKGEAPSGFVSKIRGQQVNNRRMSSDLREVEFLGPTNVGGRTRTILFDKANPARVFAGGVSGGLWISNDRGSTWNPVDDLAPTLSITSIAQDPFFPNVLYYGTGEPRGNSAGIPGDGVYKSTDGGASFTKLISTNSSEFENIWVVRTSPIDTNVVFVATGDDGLFRSDDGGDTFVQVLDQGGVSDVEVLPNGRVLAGVVDRGVYLSDDGTLGSFSILNTQLPNVDIARIQLAFCESNPDVVYAAFEQGPSNYDSSVESMWRSNDAGDTWSQIPNPNDINSNAFRFVWYAFLFEVHPNDPDFVITGSVRMMYTTNGGATWLDASNSHADYHVGVFDPTGAQTVWIGNDGGLYEYDVSSMSGSYVDKNHGYNVTQYYTGAFFPTGLNFLGGTQDNGTHRGINNDPEIQEVFGGDGAFAQVNQQLNIISFVSYQNANIARSFNSLSFNPDYDIVLNGEDDLGETPWFINPFELSPANNQQIFVTTRDRVWRSSDNGNSWGPIMSPVSGRDPYAIGISKEPNPTVYVGGEEALLIRVDSAGISGPGDQQNIGGTAPVEVASSFISNIAVHPNDSSIIYVSLSSFSDEPRCYRITNAKTSFPIWTAINGDLPVGLPVNWIVVSPSKPDSVFVAATDMGLYITQDAGNTWVQETTIPNVSIHQVRLRESDERIFIFTHGRGVWTALLPQEDVVSSVEKDLTLANAISVYPNPVGNEFTIGLAGTVPNVKEASYRVLALDGKLVSQGRLTVGEQKVSAEGMAKGTYMVVVEADNKRATKRIVKQ